jgi:hypothetical protein
MLRGLRSRLDWPRGTPTPAQAVEALREGQCMFAPVSPCSGGLRSIGLRHNENENALLVCKAHFGRLRKLSKPRLNMLEAHLFREFVVLPRRLAASDEMNGLDDGAVFSVTRDDSRAVSVSLPDAEGGFLTAKAKNLGPVRREMNAREELERSLER